MHAFHKRDRGGNSGVMYRFLNFLPETVSERPFLSRKLHFQQIQLANAVILEDLAA